MSAIVYPLPPKFLDDSDDDFDQTKMRSISTQTDDYPIYFKNGGNGVSYNDPMGRYSKRFAHTEFMATQSLPYFGESTFVANETPYVQSQPQCDPFAVVDIRSERSSLYDSLERKERRYFETHLEYERAKISMDYLCKEFYQVPTDDPKTQVMTLDKVAQDDSKRIKRLERTRIAKKSGTLTSFLVMNCVGVSLIFLVPFYAYVWILSLSNIIRCICIIAVLYSWSIGWLKNTFFAKGTAPMIDTSQKLVLLILPCYTETEDELSRTLDSMIAQKGNHKTICLIIVDGENTGKGNPMPTYQICEKLVKDNSSKYECLSYWSWKEKTINVRCKSGFIGETGMPYILMVKSKNAGKKDSLIIIRELALQFNGGRNRNLKDFGDWFDNCLLEFGVSIVHYISGTDADTIISDNAMDLMIKKMMTNSKLVGLSGNVRIDLNVNSPFNPWTAYQYFEYLYGQILTRSSQGVFGKITCLPGCIQIFSADPKLMDGPLDSFKELPSDESLFDNVLAFLGEDRRFTCLLLYQNPNCVTDIVLGAYGTTAVPDSFTVFFSQRRRWFLSSQANNVLDVLSDKLPIIIRVIAGAQILASAITPFVFIAIVCSIIRLALSGSGRYYTLILGTSSLVWAFKILMIFFGSVSAVDFAVLFYGIFVHTVFGAFVQTYNIIHALSTMDDLGWGLTRQIEKEPKPLN